MKYIIFEDPTGQTYPVVFPKYINHGDMVKCMKEHPQICLEPISAGYVCGTGYINDPVICYGHSQQLNLHSQLNDSLIVNICFRE